jgi:hypothetical protein
MAIEYITTTSGRILVPEQQTPAEAAKIDLNLNPQNRLKDLIVKSAAQKEIAEGKPWKESSACQHRQRKGLHKGHAQGLAR